MQKWREFPGHADIHPPAHRDDHFMPFVVCAGVVEEQVGEKWEEEILGVTAEGYYWIGRNAGTDGLNHKASEILI